MIKNEFNQELICNPIGIFNSTYTERYMAPRQPGMRDGMKGKIILNRHANFEQALEDLEGFNKIWILFWFHQNAQWKPKIMPPRGDRKRGVFATRSPHRPNPIGLSCVTLTKIEGLTLFIEDHDLLDGTPILDIKPYLVYSDSFPDAQQGWLQDILPTPIHDLNWHSIATRQAEWIQTHQHPDFVTIVSQRLSENPYPHPSHRIRLLESGLYELAFKSWRIYYSIDSNKNLVTITSIKSGYDDDTISGKKETPWGDIAIHIEYLQQDW